MYDLIKYTNSIIAVTNISPGTRKEEENNDDFMEINGIIKTKKIK